MAQITKIESQKKRPGRVNVYLDDEFAFGISDKLVLDYDLYKGKELNPEEIEKIKSAESISKCMEKAYHYLSFRARSEKEMRDKLLEKFEPEIVEEAISKLKGYNYINDTEFARAWVESRGTSRGARALSFELQKKGVEKLIIEGAVSEVSKDSELETALELVKSKSKYKGLTKDEAYQKVGGYLSRRGFGYDIIKKVIAEISTK
jgi:regulatory protein